MEDSNYNREVRDSNSLSPEEEYIHQEGNQDTPYEDYQMILAQCTLPEQEEVRLFLQGKKEIEEIMDIVEKIQTLLKKK